MKTKALQALAACALTLALTATALAATDPPAAPTKTGAAGSEPTTVEPTAAPVVPENAAELEALRNGPLSTEGATPPAAANPPVDAVAHPTAVRPLTPELQAVQAALDAERAQVAELEASLAATRDAATALGLQRQIEQLKAGSELRLLEIQARFAREAGREADAARIEAAIAAQLAPPPALEPQDRPAPGDVAGQR